MKHRILRVTASIFLICIVLLTSLSTARGQSRLQDLKGNAQMDNVSQQSRNIDSGDHYHVIIPDGVVSSENGSFSLVREGRSPEKSAESVLFLLGIFLALLHFQFLLDGRPWAAVQSICMGFQEFFMHQLVILQLWDGKRKGGSLILN